MNQSKTYIIRNLLQNHVLQFDHNPKLQHEIDQLFNIFILLLYSMTSKLDLDHFL